MKKIIKTLITLIVIIPILTLANGYATANNQTEPHRKMTADEIPQDQTEATEKLYKLGLFLPIQQNEDGTPNFALNYYTTRFQGIKIIINFTGTVQQAKNNNHPHNFQDISISQNPWGNRATPSSGASIFLSKHPTKNGLRGRSVWEQSTPRKK